MKKSLSLCLIMLLLFTFTGCRITFNDDEFGEDVSLGEFIVSQFDDENFESVDGNVSFTEAYQNQEELALDFNFSVTEFNLNLEGTTEQLVETEATYNYEPLEPEFSISGDTKVNYSIKQKNLRSFTGRAESEINTKINANVITDMDLSMGVGEANIDLTDVKIRNVNIECGVGDLEVVANGIYDQEQSYSLEGGVGNSEFKMGGEFNKPVTFNVESGVGDTEIQCTGAFNEGGSISVEGGVGNIDLTLPANVGIKILTTGVNSASVSDQGKKVSLGLFEGYYTNDLYSEDGPYITVDITQGVGAIDINIQ
ncbi:hypothetical protein [Vallitalea okinawensis]|uniref:hypothetical protein n=1 Tax=Vallitalea okinawensis TaxID=2078660 RepID=UPI000CFBFA88|nr:hypothetical protein [Vallitalea okinawensis]